MKKITFVALSTIILASSAMAKGNHGHGGGPTGEKIFANKCASCHGFDAKNPISPTYPKLAGQNKAYIVEAIKAYQDGSRSSVNAQIMKAIVQEMPSDRIDMVADYISSL